MKIGDIKVGETGVTMGYGCDSYPYTIFGVGTPQGQRGRKPKNWVTGTKVVYLNVTGDEVRARKEGEEVPQGSFSSHGDTGYHGHHADFILTPRPDGQVKKIKALVAPDGELKLVVPYGHGCIGHHGYSRDSSF